MTTVLPPKQQNLNPFYEKDTMVLDFLEKKKSSYQEPE